MITGRQIRAARALIDMSQDELAKAAGLTPQAIRKIESGEVTPREGTLADITRTFTERGIEFTDNQGVKFKPVGVEIFEGKDRFEDFYLFMYDHLERFGGEVCLSCLDEKLFSKNRKPENFEKHKIKMKHLVDSGRVKFRILATESEHFGKKSYAEYRKHPTQYTSPAAFYAFGECLALVSFDHEPSPYIVLHKSGPFSEAYRNAFNIAWEDGEIQAQRE